MSIQIHTPNLMPNAIKVKLDLYYMKTNSYTKFKVDMTKDGREKSVKQYFCIGQ